MKNNFNQVVAVLFLMIFVIVASKQPVIIFEPEETHHTTLLSAPPDIAPETMESEEYSNRWGITEIDDDTMDLLARVVYLEGNNTGLEGCQKIVTVIFNRYSDGRFFGGQDCSIKSVLSAKRQFSTYRRAATDQSVMPTEQEYSAIESVLNGTAPDEILNGTWLYFNGNGKQNFFW